MHRAFSVLLLASGLLLADPPAPAPTEPEPAGNQPLVRDLGDGRYAVGKVTFQKADRSIRIPTRVNMVEGLLEFALVHQDGKIHEALLITEANPLHLNVALKLLRYQASEELFPILDEDYRPTDKYPLVPEEVKAAARVEILVQWTKEDGSKAEAALNDWIYHTERKAPIRATPWIYSGSYMHNGAFQARSTGDICAIFTANSALFNYPGQDRELDTVWIPTPKRVPPVDTPVIVVIKPVLGSKTNPNK